MAMGKMYRVKKTTGYRRRRLRRRLYKRRYNRPKVEFKKLYLAGTPAMDTTGVLTLLNGTTQGDDAGNRDGRQIILR